MKDDRSPSNATCQFRSTERRLLIADLIPPVTPVAPLAELHPEAAESLGSIHKRTIRRIRRPLRSGKVPTVVKTLDDLSGDD